MLKRSTVLVLRDMAHELLRREHRAVGGPWTVTTSGNRTGRLVVAAEEPWRRRPTQTQGQPWAEFADVCTLSGGRAKQALLNGEFVAFARYAAPQIALAFLLVCKEFYGVDAHCPPADPKRGEPELRTKQSIPPHPPGGRTGAFYVLTRAIADALDDFLALAQIDASECGQTDRNLQPALRLVSGDDGTRAVRSELLSAVAAVMHPRFDDHKLKQLPPSSRVRANARPTIADFMDAITRATGLMGMRAGNEVEEESEQLSLRCHEFEHKHKDHSP